MIKLFKKSYQMEYVLRVMKNVVEYQKGPFVRFYLMYIYLPILFIFYP
jgi:hypothetical protein